ncbi:hypothetical protein OJF2_53080 [Aquisphaera giovannonii]|uniref:DUF2239 domain-containing protein n=1 Tax=Aquisphaera giovannonii TaxID=406548 RepID=A0A5B9W831_9BACT|nr:DUF2239 family protein [Aquisphaera giovannonii]QEH36723.1 hypothetical protein OJF2_53080 [Aquisphaera giovannonii]
MNGNSSRPCTAFEGMSRIAEGSLADVAREVKRHHDRPGAGPILIFDDVSAEQVDLDLSGTIDDVAGRYAAGTTPSATGDGVDTAGQASRGPGRPRLGVVAREVTLLPRHWDWLGGQPGGASVALRKLVDEARKTSAGADRARVPRDRAYRFMTAVAGNLPGYEEAIRALYRGEHDRLEEQVRDWPEDVRLYLRKLTSAASPD